LQKILGYTLLMTKRLISILAVVTVAGLLLAAINLLRLKNSLAAYSAFWGHKASLDGDFVYVALGDSTAQGIGASEPLNGYVGLVAEKIRQKLGRNVRVINLSVSGATVQDAVASQMPELNKLKPDLVTIQIGANDVVRGDLTNFEDDFEQLAAQLPAGTFVANMPYFGGRIRRNSFALQASSIITAAADRHKLILVDLQTPLREQQSILNYAADFFHPSDRAYQIWAESFWKEIEPTLQRKTPI
jgi:acyl-CoA thioesterase-1